MTDIRLSRRVVTAGMLSLPALQWPITKARADTPPNALVVGHLAELQTLDPAQAVTISDFRILANMYEGLLHYKDGSLDVEPGLATSWTMSPDGLTYTFKLRPGLKFHNGDPVTTEDVKFSFERYQGAGAQA